jgi:glutamate-ammonia-ligase adenylyltransferase
MEGGAAAGAGFEEAAAAFAPAAAGALLPPALAARVREWPEHPRVRALREDGRQRLVKLIKRTHQWTQEGSISETAALRWCDWIEPLLRRESYLALLLERPQVHQQLLRLLGAARWTARYLLQHPGVIDELASPALLMERFDPAEMQRSLHERHQALAGVGQDDEESLLNLLRRAHHAETFRILARDVEGREWLWQHYQVTLKFEQIFQELINTGKMATVMKREQTLSERILKAVGI